ncbi:hypothetical protein D3C75_827410 [compost metagenome]
MATSTVSEGMGFLVGAGEAEAAALWAGAWELAGVCAVEAESASSLRNRTYPIVEPARITTRMARNTHLGKADFFFLRMYISFVLCENLFETETILGGRFILTSLTCSFHPLNLFLPPETLYHQTSLREAVLGQNHN